MIAKNQTLDPGLYLVATPIGNARDITLRALDVLASADVLAAEDTRTLKKLMEIHGISVGDRPCWAYHDHSKQGDKNRILRAITEGKSVAYASEAGTPLVADPGYRLAREVSEDGAYVTAVPGASAALAALSVAGLPSDRFTFAGFAPNADGPRRKFLGAFDIGEGTLIFYESPRRVGKFLAAAADVFGGQRQAAVCRELTKKFEEVRRGTLEELAGSITELKGEVVILIAPAERPEKLEGDDLDAALLASMETQSVKDAAAEIAEVFGMKKRDLYQRALELRGK